MTQDFPPDEAPGPDAAPGETAPEPHPEPHPEPQPEPHPEPQPAPGDAHPEPPPHPFDRVRIRGLVGWTVLGAILAGAGAAILLDGSLGGSLEGARPEGEVGALQPSFLAFMAFIYGWLFLWAWRQERRLGIPLRRFFRGAPPRMGGLAGLVTLILLFSFGSFWFVYEALERLVPALAEQMMESPEFLVLPMTGLADVLTNVGVFLVVVVLAPVVEEILFRGFLLNRWGRRWGLTAGILLSSAAFAVLHVHWVGLFVFGVVMALLYVSTGSLWAPVVAHALNNGVAFTLALLGAADLPVMDPGILERMSSSGWTAAVLLLISAPMLARWIAEWWPAGRAPLPWDAAAPPALPGDVPRDLPGGDAPHTILPPSERDRA